MAKLLFDKDKLKFKGLERDTKISVPTKLDSVKVTKKPEIKLNWEDRLNQFSMWLKEFVVSAAGETLRRVVPPYVWGIFILAMIVIVVIVLKNV